MVSSSGSILLSFLHRFKGKYILMLRFLIDIKRREIGVCFPGKRPLADVWALDTAAKPYEWRKLEPEGEGPPPCM